MYKCRKRGVGSPGERKTEKTDQRRTKREEVTQGQERWGRWAALAVPRRCACGQSTVGQRWGLVLLTRSLPDTGPSWEQTPHTQIREGTPAPLQYDPTIMLFGIHPKELKTYVHTEICTWMSIEAITVIIAKAWYHQDVLHCKCPSG